ncbi:MAG: hypothetical protein RIT45_3866, partial [Pseudomonadota bacterium]
AAARFYRAFQRAEARWPGIGEKACPTIETDEQVFYLLGLSAGMMALMHDRGARGTAGVPMSIPMRVARAAACIDDATWWGVPSALQAAVWMTVPGSGPKDADPKKTLTDAAAKGDAAGVRLARALQVVALGGAGDEAGARDAIAAHGAAVKAKAAPARWRLLDAYAQRLTRHAADLIWTRELGHRGPTDDFAGLPAKPEAPAADDEEVLEGIGE